MAGRGPRAPWHDVPPGTPQDRPADARRPDGAEASLVRIHDLAGRPRGAGFVADHLGTVITSHETVDGLPRLVLHAGGERSCVVTADAVTALPELDLALVRTEGLDAPPLPVTVREGVETGRYVRLAAGCWREARVLAETSVTYTATDRRHRLDALELAIGTAGRDALRLGGGAAGGPVLDAETGAVVAVLGTALHSGPRDTGFAIPLRPSAPRTDDRTADGDGHADEEGVGVGFGGGVGAGSVGAGEERARRAGTGVVRQGGHVGAGTERTGGHLTADGQGGPALTGPGIDRQVRRAGTDTGPRPGSAGTGVGTPGDHARGRQVGRRTGTRPDRRTGAADPPDAEAAAPDAQAAPPLPRAGEAATGDPGHEAAPFTEPSTFAAPRAADPPRPGASPSAPPHAAGTAADGPLAELLARNAATVPAYGADLNLAGVLELTATSVGSDGPPGALHHCLGRTGNGSRTADSVPVQRDLPTREFALFTASPAAVLALVGAPGSGRTTELAALAARRDRGARPAPTLWLRGADLADDDGSLADAARRALARAARIVAASRPGPQPGASPAELFTAAGPEGVTPEGLARLAQSVGRPLLVLLDGPEEMPPVLAHRLAEWTEGTARWLRETGARLVVACRSEYWEQAGAQFPPEMLYGVAASADRLPPCVRLGDFTPDEAREARARYRVPEAALAAPDDRHPLTLRLLSEVRAALPGPPDPAPVDRYDVLAAHLDLMCLRVAVRLAAGNGLRGTAVRRLAAKVAGQVHEAARRSLGPGQGELDRASFEAVFPWGPAPARLGGITGWASAVLAEGLLVPAGAGYRFAHEELADWIQGTHLDLDEALRALVHRPRTPEDGRPLPVPHHRIGPVVQALLLLGRRHGPHRLAAQLRELTHALEADPDAWWAGRLLTETLLRLPDATPCTGVLRLIADRIGAGAEGIGRLVDLGPAFWTRLALPPDARLDLLRRLVLADGAPHDADAPRYLDAVARLLAADPTAVQPYLTQWFDDERPLPATPHATVATAAQALLHTHRHRAPDDLMEVLVDCAHPRAGELLAVLAQDATSALCRAADRWSRDERPARRAAAVAYGLRAAPHVHTEADRLPLRRAALAVLARPSDPALHGGALALLVQDPGTRSRHLERALERFAAGDRRLPPGALFAALNTHPGPVADAVRARLHDAAGCDAAHAGRILDALADACAPADLVAALVREALELRPELAGRLAAAVDRRLDRGAAARPAVLPMVTRLLEDGCPEPARAALAGALAAPGTPQSRPLRRELLDRLLAREHAPGVLDAVLYGAAGHGGEDLRALVHRTGLLLVRTPDGATRFDRGLVDLGRHVPGFAAQVVDWLSRAPGEWSGLVGPSARRTLENLAGSRVPA